MIFDEEDQSNEELALAEICGSQEFETIPQDLKIDFVKTFGDEISDNFKGKVATTIYLSLVGN